MEVVRGVGVGGGGGASGRKGRNSCSPNRDSTATLSRFICWTVQYCPYTSMSEYWADRVLECQSAAMEDYWAIREL